MKEEEPFDKDLFNKIQEHQEEILQRIMIELSEQKYSILKQMKVNLSELKLQADKNDEILEFQQIEKSDPLESAMMKIMS